jgi:hypothetical protein
MEGRKYNISFNTSKSTAVAVTQTAVSKRSPLYSLLRLDRAHKGANFNHININPRISGVPDPHIKLPPGGLQVSATYMSCFDTKSHITSVARLQPDSPKQPNGMAD